MPVNRHLSWQAVQVSLKRILEMHYYQGQRILEMRQGFKILKKKNRSPFSSTSNAHASDMQFGKPQSLVASSPPSHLPRSTCSPVIATSSSFFSIVASLSPSLSLPLSLYLSLIVCICIRKYGIYLQGTCIFMVICEYKCRVLKLRIMRRRNYQSSGCYLK